MTNQEIIRAWKDESYLSSLSAQQRALLPESPIGLIELSEPEQDDAANAITVHSYDSGCTILTVTLPICMP
jgi:mersacidin/lichenicidin family type 2 lantibiotic